jgi:hypothetical protein
MPDIEIVRKDNGKLVAIACPGCGQPYQVLGDTPERRAAAAAAAAKCCPPRTCSTCGQHKVERGTMLCSECQAKADVLVEAERFTAATKVGEAEWTGPVYWPHPPFDGDHGGHNWSSIAKLRADVATRNVSRAAENPPQPPLALPAYVWATQTFGLHIDVTAAVKEALVPHSDDAVVMSDAVEALQKQIDGWCAAQGVSSYKDDLTKAVVLA